MYVAPPFKRRYDEILAVSVRFETPRCCRWVLSVASIVIAAVGIDGESSSPPVPLPNRVYKCECVSVSVIVRVPVCVVGTTPPFCTSPVGVLL